MKNIAIGVLVTLLVVFSLAAAWYNPTNIQVLNNAGDGSKLIQEGVTAFPVVAIPSAASQPQTVVEFTVSCTAAGVQFPSHAVAGEILVQLQDTSANTIRIGGASVSATSIWLDLASGAPSYRARYSNTDLLYCKCFGGTCPEDILAQAEGV